MLMMQRSREVISKTSNSKLLAGSVYKNSWGKRYDSVATLLHKRYKHDLEKNEEDLEEGLDKAMGVRTDEEINVLKETNKNGRWFRHQENAIKTKSIDLRKRNRKGGRADKIVGMKVDLEDGIGKYNEVVIEGLVKDLLVKSGESRYETRQGGVSGENEIDVKKENIEGKMAAFDKEGEAMQNDSDKSKSASGSGSGGADESEGNGPPGEKGERKTTTEFKRETVDDVKANVAAGLTRGSHLLLYQEDQWGEAGAIELIERTGSKMGATTIALDIPDWSVIGVGINSVFEDITIISHDYMPPPEIVGKVETAMYRAMKGQAGKNKYLDEEEKEEEEEEEEENEEEEEEEGEDAFEGRYEEPGKFEREERGKKNQRERHWFEKEDDGKRKVQAQKVSPSPELPSEFLNNPLNANDTKVLDDRLKKLIYSRQLIKKGEGENGIQPLIIVVKHLGDLLNTRIGYTLFERLVRAAHQHNREVHKIIGGGFVGGGDDAIRGTVMIVGMMHPSIFHPKIAPPTLPPFDTNPSAPPAVFEPLGSTTRTASTGVVSKKDIDEIGGALTGGKTPTPIMVSITSVGDKRSGKGVEPPGLSSILGEIIKGKFREEMGRVAMNTGGGVVGSSLFTRVGLPVSDPEYCAEKSSIRCLWNNGGEMHISNRQKAVYQQVLNRNALVLRNILMLNGVVGVTLDTVIETNKEVGQRVVTRTAATHVSRVLSGDGSKGRHTEGIEVDTLIKLLELVPGNLAGRVFLAETFIHRLAKNSIGIMMQEMLENRTAVDFWKQKDDPSGNHAMVVTSSQFLQAWKQVIGSYKALGMSLAINPITRAVSTAASSVDKRIFEYYPDKSEASTKPKDYVYTHNLITEQAIPFSDVPMGALGLLVRDSRSVEIKKRVARDSKDMIESEQAKVEKKDREGEEDRDDEGEGGGGITKKPVKEGEKEKEMVGNANNNANPEKRRPIVPEAHHSTSEETARRVRSLNRDKLNQYEKRLLSCVVDPNSIPSGFSNVVASPETVMTLQELISLPLLCPKLYSSGILARHSISGVLMFGPPGTGKTMLAKAVARESGSTVLDIKSSDVNDKFVGEGEKLVRAVFSLARKLSPCVIFIDEVDSLFAARSSDLNSTHKRDLINQFMSEWDGLTSKSSFNANSRVILMAATNRPFDLDDAILRRLPRRILVDLPSAADRAKIISLHLEGEKISPALDINKIAERAQFYSGSDLKNLCIAAALSAVREHISKHASTISDHNNGSGNDHNIDNSGRISGDSNNNSNSNHETQKNEKYPPPLTPEILNRWISHLKSKKSLPKHAGAIIDANMELEPDGLVLTDHHFDLAFNMVSSSCSNDMNSVTELRKWDKKYGDHASSGSGGGTKRVFGFY